MLLILVHVIEWYLCIREVLMLIFKLLEKSITCLFSLSFLSSKVIGAITISAIHFVLEENTFISKSIPKPILKRLNICVFVYLF